MTGPDVRAALPSATRPPPDARRQNLAAVLQAVFRYGPIARTDVARVTGLTRSAVTKITAVLLAGAIVTEGAARPGTPTGRPSVPLSLDLDRRGVVGVHIGVLRAGLFRVCAGLYDLGGGLRGQVERSGTRTDPATVVAAVAAAVEDVVARHGGDRTVLGVGVTVGGLVEPAEGRVVEHEGLGWRDVDLGDRLAAALRRPVRLDNSVHALALAEMWFGAATDTDSLVEIFVGNVVGAALVIDRTVHRGPRSGAGHLTHFPLSVRAPRTCSCGRRNCFQVVASDGAVMADAHAAGLTAADAVLDDLVDLDRAGDRTARRLLRDRARRIGEFVACVVELIDPDRVIVSGGLLQSPEHLDALRAEAARRVHDPAAADRIRLSSLGERTLTLGSAAPYLNHYFRDPAGVDPSLRGDHEGFSVL